MTKKVFSLLFFLFSLSCFTQEFSVIGNVKDENNEPIAFANVTITNGVDSSIINGTTTDETGEFEIKNLKPSTYLLGITYLGFNSYSLTLKLHGDINLKTIVLIENIQELEGVTIVAKRPTVKRLVDRLVFDVENSTLSNNNVLDVLKQTPGVFVNDEKITVKNSEPTVYINDRKVHLSITEVQQLLEGTSATNIKSIEVITNPPAKYEAEGGAVINIVSSKNIIAGYNGSVFGNYKQGSEYPKYAFGTSHFFKTNKLSTYFNYNVSPRKDFRNNKESINFINDNDFTSSWQTDYKRISKTSNQNINANIDYNINDYNSIVFSSNILVSPRDYTKTFSNSLTEVFNSNMVLDSTFNTLNRKVDEIYNFAFTLDYIHKFKNEGEKLSASLHHTNYDFSNFQNVDTDYNNPDNSLIRTNRFQTFSSQKIKLYTGQIDYELPINDSEQFEAGIKVSNINSESILTQYVFENDTKIEDKQNSDTFLYDEMNYAGYTSFSKKWNTWNLKSGIRAEYTRINGNSLSTNQKSNIDYIKLFPSFYLLKKINNKNDVYFKYNKRIHRPRYKELNPFKYFFNDNSYVQGDPNLKPQIDDEFVLGYTFYNKYTFETYYRYENNSINEFTSQDNNQNKLKHTYSNLDKNISYGLDFTTYTKILPNWNLYILSSLYYYEYHFLVVESENDFLENKQWSFYGKANNYFTLSKDQSITLDVSCLYLSPIIDGPSKISNRFSFDLFIKKIIWKNKAYLSVGIIDAFNTLNSTETIKYLNQDLFFNNRSENRLFSVGFNYKFGNYKLKNNEKAIDLEERDRL